MSLRRGWSKEPHGQLVSPWLLFGRESRIITLFGMISSSISVNVITSDSMPFLAEETFADMMLLANESSEPVKIAVNNRGGDVAAGMIIVQGIEHLQARKIDVEILDLGSSMSMASVILASGTKGKRFATARSVVHLHSGSQTTSGTPEDVAHIQEYIDRMREGLVQILTKNTKIPEYFLKQPDSTMNPELLKSEEGRLKLTKEFLKGEKFLNPEQAIEAGIIDQILKPGDEKLTEFFSLPKGGAK